MSQKINHDKFRKLQQKYSSRNWGSQWLPVRNSLDVMSYLAHVVLIAFGYSFIFALLKDSPLYETVPTSILVIMSIITLVVFEYLKRKLFHQTMFEILKNGLNKSTELRLMLGLSVAIVLVSFYIALSGAKEFSDVSDKIETEAETKIEALSDSVKIKYKSDIDRLRLQSDKLIALNDKLTEQMEMTQSSWYKTQFMAQIKDNNKQMESNKKELDILNDKINKEISDIKKEQEDKTKDKKIDNSDTSTKFVAVSIFMELIILLGIYFHTYHEKKSVAEYNLILAENDALNMYNKQIPLLGIIYRNGKSTVGEFSMTKLQMEETLRLSYNMQNYNKDDINDFFKMCVHLGILSDVGEGKPKKIACTYEDAKINLSLHYGVEI